MIKGAPRSAFDFGKRMRCELRAGCKVNLYLDIVGVRDNGYHEIESLFYPLPAPHDILILEETGGAGLQLTCSDPALPVDGNILSAAYGRFAAATGYAPGIRLHLVKQIPMGAGLGGGSSDAAVFLGWLNSRAGGSALGSPDLESLALGLGADVPFFLHNKPAWVTGIGEIVTPVAVDLTEYTVLVACPHVHVNTAWAYRRWDEVWREDANSGRKVLTAAGSPNKEFCFTKPPVLKNCFERVVFQEFPVLYELKAEILRHGALACVMSGSGASMVAIFESPEVARVCGRRMRDQGCPCHLVDGQDLVGSSG